MLPTKIHSLRCHGAGGGSLLHAQPVPVVRVALAEPSVAGETGKSTSGLSRGALAGVVVGSVLGGVLLIVLIGLLIRCVCQRRKVSTDQSKVGTTTKSASVWSCCFRRRSVTRSGARRAGPAEKSDAGEVSDTSFVLPELGGPNPLNKFDGMEWVDIKGLDDDNLQDISTDLRKYSQGQRR